MGWVGAQRDGALLKYAEFLAEQGYPTLRSVQPTPVAFAPFDLPRRRWALAMLHCLEELGLWPQRQMVLFSFSNGGAFVVEQLMLLAEGDPRCATGLLSPSTGAVPLLLLPQCMCSWLRQQLPASPCLPLCPQPCTTPAGLPTCLPQLPASSSTLPPPTCCPAGCSACWAPPSLPASPAG